MAAAAVQFAGVAVHYGPNHPVVSRLDLDVKQGEFVAILGPSGCGKSTLLKAAAGIQKPSSGSITVNGQAVTDLNRDCGFVFQQETLFPWQTVRRNVEFGLRINGVSKTERSAIVERALADIGLLDSAEKYPAELSGGMKQRVELARVLVNKPKLLLMDEPFGALDAQTRLRMQKLLLEIWERNRVTVLFVTHDVDEAILLADRVLVLSDRPASIRAQLAVQLPRPRSADTLIAPEFTALKKLCLQELGH